MTRYAIYYSPAADTLWWQTGCQWLGRDRATGKTCPSPAVQGVASQWIAQITTNARHYGFHATLKAPFRLIDGFSETHLLAMAEAFAATQRPITLEDMRVRPMGNFLALRPIGPNDDIAALAMRCTSYFDNLRAPATLGELAKRRHAGLTERQEVLLHRWGYPYTEEEFRFHMTLTDSLEGMDEVSKSALREAAEKFFARTSEAAPMVIDGLTIFKEDKPGEPFSIWRRLRFSSCAKGDTLPAPGRLFFFVGPSGVGKDTLLQWVQQRLPSGAGTVFARRMITREAHLSEAHVPTDVDQFRELAAAGHFSMMWQAHDHSYGIPRGIEADMAAGRDVVVNGSREYVPRLMELFPQAQVIWVEAGAEQIRARIEGRQRETGPALMKRLDRARQFASSKEMIKLDNSGPIEVAGRRMLEILAR